MKRKFLFLILVLFLIPLYGNSQVFAKQGVGVTIIVHGWNPDGSQPGWLDSLATAIIKRSGGNGQIDTIKVSGTAGNLTAKCLNWNIDSTADSFGEIVVIVDWTDVADHLTTGVSAQEVAAVVAPKIYKSINGQIALAELPIHLIGHSRGGGMVYELARLLGEQGIEVDQVTSLDPHPLTKNDPQPAAVTGIDTTIDTPVKLYENVVFADNYYQKLNYPTGQYVNGAFNRQFTSLPGGYHNEKDQQGNPKYSYNINGTTYDFSDHLNTILMYYGTTNLSTPCYNGEATMGTTERGWFNTFESDGQKEGFCYSRNIGADRKSTNTPVAGKDRIIYGYSGYLGGNGTRANLTWSNAASWANVMRIDVLKDSKAFTSDTPKVFYNEILNIEFKYLNYADKSNYIFYVDSDRNPFNNNNISEIGIVSEPRTAETAQTATLSFAVSNEAFKTKKFYIYVKAVSDSCTRYMYAPYEFIACDNDLTVSSIKKPAKNFNDTMPVTIFIKNNGLKAQSNFPVSYTFKGKTVTETFTGTVNSLGLVEYTFTKRIDLSTPNVIDTISVKTNLSTDENTANDEKTFKINTYTGDNSLDISNNAYIDVPNNDLLNSHNFTVEAWFYLTSNNKADIISKHNNDGSRSGFAIEYYNGKIYGVLGCGSKWIKAQGVVELNKWYHVAFVASDKSYILYLNEENVASGESSNSYNYQTNTKDLWIGGSEVYKNFFSGYIDEVRIWNTTRTYHQIMQNYNKEIDPNTSHLVAYYNFNRGISNGDNTAIDYVPDMTNNNMNGHMHNFALKGNSSNFFNTDCDLDLLPPTISTIANQTRQITQGQTYYTVQGKEFTPTASDNCSVEKFINSFNNSDSLNGAHFPVGTTTVTWKAYDKVGHVDSCSFDVTVNTATGINEIDNNEISVYPNPTNGILNIRNGKSKISNICITDIDGRTIYSKNGFVKNIDISDFPDGLYFIHLKNDKVTKTMKIIKQ